MATDRPTPDDARRIAEMLETIATVQQTLLMRRTVEQAAAALRAMADTIKYEYAMTYTSSPLWRIDFPEAVRPDDQYWELVTVTADSSDVFFFWRRESEEPTHAK